MFYTTLPRRTQFMSQLYRQDTPIDIGAIALQKAEELGLLGANPEDLEKGRTAMPIGAHANWGGVEYLKTASGWKPVGKHRGHVKANHDHIHHNEEKDKDHHAMVMDAGKMSADEWTAKHGSNLHEKYKQVHDYLHKPKGEKKAKVEEKPVEEDNHGIEVGKEYGHSFYGKVKVTSVDKNTDDKQDKISHHVTFVSGKDGGGNDVHETQGIEGFKQSTKDNEETSFASRKLDEAREKKESVKTTSQHSVGTEGMFNGDEVKLDSNDGLGNVKYHILDEDGKDTGKWNKVSVHEFDSKFAAFPKTEPTPTPSESKPSHELYHIKGANGHVAVEVHHNSKEGHFGVDIANHTKDGKVTKKDRVHMPNEQKEAFLNDLKKRGGELQGESDDHKQGVHGILKGAFDKFDKMSSKDKAKYLADVKTISQKSEDDLDKHFGAKGLGKIYKDSTKKFIELHDKPEAKNNYFKDHESWYESKVAGLKQKLHNSINAFTDKVNKQ